MATAGFSGELRFRAKCVQAKLATGSRQEKRVKTWVWKLGSAPRL